MANGLSPNLKSKTLEIMDRRQAIKSAVMLAKEGDIVLVAGKGHEKYQEIKGTRFDFDDVHEVTLIEQLVCFITYLTLNQTYDLPGAGVFQYITFRAAMAVITSLLISMVFGKRLIDRLHRLQVVKPFAT